MTFLKTTLTIVSIFLILSSCGTNQAKKTGKIEFTEKFIEDTILSLKEVQEKNKLIDSITNHKQGISFIIEKPTEQEPNYYIQAGFNGNERFETYFHFYLNPPTKQIMVEDFTTGTRLSLEDWRNQMSDSAFTVLGMELLKTEQISGLKIGLPETSIIILIGKPELMEEATKWASDGLFHQTWLYKKQGIELDICWEKPNEKQINRIFINIPCNFSTSRGIGIGTTIAEVNEAYKKEINPKQKNENSILAGSDFGGIIFELEKNKVKSIFLGASAE